MKILLIDNYDSFTFNLSHYLEGLGAEIEVVRENEYQLEMLKTVDKIVLSPGPGLPSASQGMMRCIADAAGELPIFGVCLGMQALAEFTNGSLYNQNIVKHGLQEYIDKIGESSLLKDLPNRFPVGLYHSWAVEIQEGSVFRKIAVSSSNIVMAIEAKKQKLFGVQFHPESIMTPNGKKIIENFLAQ